MSGIIYQASGRGKSHRANLNLFGDGASAECLAVLNYVAQGKIPFTRNQRLSQRVRLKADFVDLRDARFWAKL